MNQSETQAFNVRIPIALHLQARIKSVKTGKSLNEVITEKLAEWVKEEQPAASAKGKGK